MYESRDISILIGKTLTSIIVGTEEITFHTNSGEQYRMMHYQDCCESVTVEDVCGDIRDLLNTPIIMAECVTEIGDSRFYGSCTWTFYKFATAKGYVTIRWYGESNGYYSEDVNFEQVLQEGEVYYANIKGNPLILKVVDNTLEILYGKEEDNIGENVYHTDWVSHIYSTELVHIPHQEVGDLITKIVNGEVL